MLQVGVMGSNEFLMTRVPLAQNVLNLGSYFGRQELVLREPLEPVEIQFQFKLAEASYLEITYNRKEGFFEGIRISEKENLSQTFRSSDQGKLLSVSPIQIPRLSLDWHSLTLKNDTEGVLLTIDNSPFRVPTAAPLNSGQLGFRSGLKGAHVDDLKIKTMQGEQSYSFDNFQNWPFFLLGNLGILFLVGWGLLYLTRSRKPRTQREILFTWITLSLTGFIVFSSWYAFDYFYYSRLIHKRNGITKIMNPPDPSISLPLPSFEEVRFHIFNFWNQILGGKIVSKKGLIERGYPQLPIRYGPIYCDPKDNCLASPNYEVPPALLKAKLGYRFLLVGTSQTLGAGAWVLEDTFFVRIHHYLRAAIPKRTSIESINISISGANSEELLQVYKQDYLKLQPDLVVINLSNNDYNLDSTGFVENVDTFLRINRENEIRTILVEEANDPENIPIKRHLASNHMSLRAFGRKYDVPVLPMHDFFGRTDISSSGAIWWDTVHLTSYGQELAAEMLGPHILKALKARGVGASASNPSSEKHSPQ